VATLTRVRFEARSPVSFAFTSVVMVVSSMFCPIDSPVIERQPAVSAKATMKIAIGTAPRICRSSSLIAPCKRRTIDAPAAVLYSPATVSEAAPKVWAGQGTGQTCLACGVAIGADDVEYEVDYPSARPAMRLHQAVSPSGTSTGPTSRRRSTRHSSALDYEETDANVPAKRQRDEPGTPHPRIVLQRGPSDFAVAVWKQHVNGEPVYEIAYDEIREASIAAALAKQEREPPTRELR
jgi:hypothetical protein